MNIKVAGVGLVAVLALGLAVAPIVGERVDVGHVGVVYKPSGGVQKEILSQGWHWVSPVTKVTEYPIRTQTKSAKNLELGTGDGKSVSIDFTYSFEVDPTMVTTAYNKFGAKDVDDIAKEYLKRQLYKVAREEVAKTSIMELYGSKSTTMTANIKQGFAESVADIGFIIDDVTMSAPKADSATQSAINNRVKALQELEKKKTDLAITKAEAERKRVEAQGNADSKLIEAEGQAKAQKALQSTLTDEMIKYETVKKWDGKLPTATGGSTPMIQIPTGK